MEKSKVEFVYKNISSLNKISIVNKKIFRILPYICVPSLAIGGIAVFLKEMLPIASDGTQIYGKIRNIFLFTILILFNEEIFLYTNSTLLFSIYTASRKAHF
jgi:hypothetical protein